MKPYFEIGGGTVFTNTKVPVGTSQINFTSSGVFGGTFWERNTIGRRSAVHAHFERGDDGAKSRDQYGASQDRVWRVPEVSSSSRGKDLSQRELRSVMQSEQRNLSGAGILEQGNLTISALSRPPIRR